MCNAAEPPSSTTQSIPLDPLFDALFDSTDDAVLVLNEAGYCVRANRRAYALLGYTEADEAALLSLHSTDVLIDSTDREVLMRHVEALRGGQAVTGRYKLRHRDGHAIAVELTARRVEVSGTIYALGIARDLSLLEHAEEERRRAAAVAEALVRERGAVLASLDEGVAIFGADGRLRDANAAAQRLLGAGFVPGLTVEECLQRIAPRDMQGRALHVDDFLLWRLPGEGEIAQEIVVDGRAGERILLCCATSLRGAGEDRDVVLMVRDVTDERARAQAQAGFAGTIVHELRTPLTTLVGFLDLVLATWSSSAEERRHVQVVKAQQAAGRMRTLLEDMLLIARLDAGVVPVTGEPVPLTAVVREAAAGLRAAYPGQRVHVKGTAGLAVQADRGFLLQVLSNLLDNAAKYSPEGRPVHVEAEALDGEIAIRVIDQGVGIAASDLPRLFQRFVRPNTVARAGRGGTGLGLSICQSLVEAMGGMIMVESVVGVGSTFTVYLPRAGHAPPAALGHDALTGLPGRAAIRAIVEEEIERSHQRGGSLAVISIDVGGHGQHAGDEALRRVAAALRSALRTHDQLGRDGADAFLAVLPGSDVSVATAVADRMRAAVAAIVPPAGGAALRLPLAVGIATYPADAANATALLLHARATRTKTAPRTTAGTEQRPPSPELPAHVAVAVSHELRTPLTIILGTAEALLKAWTRLDNEERHRSVERLFSGARRLDLLVRDLLLVVGVEEGDLAVSCTRVPLAPLLEQALYDASTLHPNLDVRARGLRRAPVVWADPDRVVQVVGHLLDNAARHGQGAGPPELRVEVHVGEVEIRVSDRGPGLPREGRERLFTRFGKLSQDSHAGRVGTGMGLYISRQLVERMGGAIGVESAPGKGASFWFTLPLAQEEIPHG